MPPRRSTRTQAKEEDKKKKKKEEEEEDEEESEEEEKPKGKKGKATKKAPAKGKKKVESEDEEESEDEKPKKKGGRKASKGKKKDESDDEDDKPKTKAKPGKRGKKQEESESEEEPVSKKSKDNSGSLKKVVSKGGAAVVDEHFDNDNCSVFVKGSTVYAKTLNQSDLKKNANKFYIIQLLKSDGKDGTYYTFNRWGRVGYKGQMSTFEFDDEEDAIRDFNKKLREKTGRGYVEVDINYDDEDEDKDDDKPKGKEEKKGAKKVVKGKGKGKKDDDEDDDAMDEESEEEKDDKKDDKKDDEKIVKLITKGGVAVDQFFEEKECHVYCAGGKVYAKTLNQSNLNRNNNKFYIIQLLESEKNKGTFFTWNRWGRVGQKGQTVKKKFTDVNSAIEDFQKKFYDKTVKGDYVEVEINYDNEEEEETKEDDKAEKKDDEGKSTLPTQVKNLIKLIFDLNMMQNQMKEIGYDPKRMPLGKLSKSAIQKGYDILKQIADAIEKKKSKTTIADYCSQFFSYIPHDFGFKQMSEFIIDTDKKVKDKLEMLASLEEIQIATKLLSENKGEDNVIDANYKKLKCDLKPIEKNSDEWKFIQEYVKNTHGATHSQYGLEIEDLFETVREGEAERYTKDIPNKQLLWHGSRLTNYVGILSQGLRIAPPEAPVTGYMFGKGVYFADMVSKSANYCFTNPTNNTGLMLLCEVALGECNEKFHADYNAANLPPGKHSTKGVGKTQPAPNHVHKMDGDVTVPLGKGEASTNPNTVLLYNEFIVYDIKQIKLRYLLRMKFNYRNRY